MSTQKKPQDELGTQSQGKQVIDLDNSDNTGLLMGSQDQLCKRHNLPLKYSDWAYSGAHGCYMDVPYCEACCADAEELHLEQGIEDEREEVQK